MIRGGPKAVNDPPPRCVEAPTGSTLETAA